MNLVEKGMALPVSHKKSIAPSHPQLPRQASTFGRHKPESNFRICHGSVRNRVYFAGLEQSEARVLPSDVGYRGKRLLFDLKPNGTHYRKIVMEEPVL